MQSSRSRRIACHTLSCALAIVYSMTHAASAADSQSLQGELASAETVIAVEGAEHAPRLTTLTLRGATAWKNRAERSNAPTRSGSSRFTNRHCVR
ncbi:MAG TPA: hypothetical protein VNX69_13475 [Steroidobacteraceae bacterium]|nr:hypothetical protein [Steroidobacteraceae bacterium]